MSFAGDIVGIIISYISCSFILGDITSYNSDWSNVNYCIFISQLSGMTFLFSIHLRATKQNDFHPGIILFLKNGVYPGYFCYF